jgi:hypothetical protein
MATSYVDNSYREEVFSKLLAIPDNKVRFLFDLRSVLIVNQRIQSGLQAQLESLFATLVQQNTEILVFILPSFVLPTWIAGRCEKSKQWRWAGIRER